MRIVGIKPTFCGLGNHSSIHLNYIPIFLVLPMGLEPITPGLKDRCARFHSPFAPREHLCFSVLPLGFEPRITHLKRMVLYQFSYRSNFCFCAPTGARTQTRRLRVSLTNHYPMRANVFLFIRFSFHILLSFYI